MDRQISKTKLLNNGVSMPVLGLGVYAMSRADTEQAVLWALEAGYRHIDTASYYNNEREVGSAIRKSGIPREEIFVTTKLWPTNFLRPEAAFEDSRKRLGLDYLDLYLIHFPMPGKDRAWRVLERLYKDERMRAIGVSNYNKGQLEELLGWTNVVPAVNQVKCSPFSYNPELLSYCNSTKVTFEAYSPLTHGKRLHDPVIEEIAHNYERSAAQIMVRWALQHGMIVIPKSTHKERIIENAEVFDFEIGEADMAKLDGLTGK